jgi:hypothetical protein
VKIIGLDGIHDGPLLNGTEGTVEGKDAANGLWKVSLD